MGRYDESAVLPLTRAAEIYRKRKDWANAARVLELSVYIDPYDTKVHSMLGESAVEAGDWNAAVAAFQVLLGLNRLTAPRRITISPSLVGSGQKGRGEARGAALPRNRTHL